MTTVHVIPVGIIAVDTRRRFNVYKTSVRRLIVVGTTSCVSWDSSRQRPTIGLVSTERQSAFFLVGIIINSLAPTHLFC